MDLKLYLRAHWDRVGAWALIALGGVALLLGWIGVSGTPLPSEQIPYVVSGGLVGISLIGIGTALWLSADLRDEWRKLDSLEDAIREQGAAVTAENGDSSSPDNGRPAARRRTTKAGARSGS